MGKMEKLLNLRRAAAVTLRFGCWLSLVAGSQGAMQAQISGAAYRALGQGDLTRNAVNRLQGMELSAPNAVALDSRNGLTRIYVADTGNHRVLGWPDARAYEIGEPPAVVLGQLGVDRGMPLGTGTTGLLLPSAMAVDPTNGNLYVADTGNHRVVRYPDPFNNVGRVEPDAVYGQTDLSGRAPNGSADPRNSLRSPVGVAVDALGNLWVSDSGNHRVLRYPASTLDSRAPQADIVLGQRDFTQTGRNRSAAAVSTLGFDVPAGLAFDSEGNLLVADSANGRVLRFSPPFSPESAASLVIAMPAGRVNVPAGIAVSEGRLFVALPKENRVLVFSPISAGATPVSVYGQADWNGREANAGVSPRAAPYTLFDVSDVKVDALGNVYVADTGNNRVLRFSNGSRSADRVWGQLDFTSNSVNRVKALGLNRPFKVAIDYSREPFALYVSDTGNHRILIWKDAARFRTGDPADDVIGQEDLQTGFVNAGGAGRNPTASSLSSPRGIAVDSNGDLYVADTGNHRVLRFRRPVDQPGPKVADLVLGQPDFRTATASVPGPASLRSPVAVAVSADGGIFVADTGNNRVLEFPAGASNHAAAIRVYGQPHFESAAAASSVSSQTLTAPAGIAVDAGFNLYVADSGANRVVVYPNTRDAAAASNSAMIVVGSDAFDRSYAGAGRTRLRTPADVALDSAGNIYVADSQNHRVLIFPSLIFLPVTDGAAMGIVGQADFNSGAPNWNSRDGLATPEALFEPAGIFLDRRDTLYTADSGNHRVVHFLKTFRAVHAVHRQAAALPRGGLVAIEGEGLAEKSEAAGTAPLGPVLADREVVVDDALPAPLLSVSPSAIAMQLPGNAPVGSARLAVRATGTGELIAGGIVAVAAYAPGLYTKVLNADGSTNAASNGALRGTTIRLTGTGQGPVRPVIADGEAAGEGAVSTVAVPVSDSASCLSRQPAVCVSIGNTFGEVEFSGLAAGLVGVWQLDVRIPENAPTGNVPVRAIINAVPSNIVTVAIR